MYSDAKCYLLSNRSACEGFLSDLFQSIFYQSDKYCAYLWLARRLDVCVCAMSRSRF